MTRRDLLDVRASVVGLAGLGRMPTDARSEAEPDAADRWTAVVGELDEAGDVTDSEAEVLVRLLPEDDSESFGVAWTLVHVIESAPGWPLREALAQADGPWVEVLRRRCEKALSGPTKVVQPPVHVPS